MTEEEKAKELIERFHKDYGEKLPDGTFVLCIVSIGRAKQCALIHCDGVIAVLKTMDWTDDLINEWQHIKQQIQNHE